MTDRSAPVPAVRPPDRDAARPAGQARDRAKTPPRWGMERAATPASAKDARSVTDAATRRRHGLVAQLRAQRLDREAALKGASAEPPTAPVADGDPSPS